MKNSRSINPRSLKGTGYIIGAIIGIVAAITAFVFTENIAISIPLFAGLSIPLGMSIEQKMQVEDKEKKTHTMKIMIALIAIGVLLFFSVLSITKII
jgi:predicted permease